MEVIEEGNPYFDEKLGDYPLLARIIQMDIFKWDPSGQSKRLSPHCDPKVWQERSLKKEVSALQWTQSLENYMHDCHSEWETGWNDIITNAIGMVSFKLHPNQYPYGRHVIFHMPNNVKIKGLLAMKTDGKKRPFIIFRTGIFSNTQEFYPERSVFLQLFEQSPFNMLVLESSSGSEFLQHNDSYSLGGFDEGLQNFYIAQQLQQAREPISKLISEVHMMGLSMGGHGVMFSAVLNQSNPTVQGKPVLQSALAFCPLLNMEETMDYHMSQGFSMDIMNYWASRRLTVLKEKIPDIQDKTFIPQFFNWIRRNYKGPLIAENGKVPGIKMPPEVQQILSNPQKPENLFWKLNNFWPSYHQIRTPVLIFSTRKDPIVSWFINSGRIEDQRMLFPESNLRMFSFEQGYHCSLPVAYDWGTLTTLFQTYILKLSPQYQRNFRETRIPLTTKALEILHHQKVYLDLNFEVPEQSAAVFTKIRFDEDFHPNLISRLLAPRMEAQLPLSEMEFPIDDVVRSEDESSLLRRWAYQNITARIDGADLVLSWPVTQ